MDAQGAGQNFKIVLCCFLLKLRPDWAMWHPVFKKRKSSKEKLACFLREARNYYIKRTLEMAWNGCDYSQVLGACKTACGVLFYSVIEKHSIMWEGTHRFHEQSLSHFIIPLGPFGTLAILKICALALVWKNWGYKPVRSFQWTVGVSEYFCYLCNSFSVDFAHSSLIPHCSTCWSNNVDLTLI